ILVHGGGDQITALCERLGIRPEIVAGRRVTDAPTLEVAKMVLAGAVNTNILAAFRRARVPAVGLSGIDSAIITAHKRPPGSVTDPASGCAHDVDFGLVGDIDTIKIDALEH